MRTKIYSKAIFLLCATCFVCRGDQGDDLYKKFINTVGSNDYPQQADLSWVTPPVRQILIQKAQAAANSADPNVNFGSRMALVELGDQPTIESYIAEYHQGKTGVMPSIQVLPYLIDDVYNGDSVRRGNLKPSIMDNSTHTIYQILKSYPSFPPKTREWAKHSEGDGEGPTSQANQLMRAWWEHNKDAVLTHRYGDAKWLPTPQQVKALHDSTDQNTTSIPPSSLETPKPLQVLAVSSEDTRWGNIWRILIALVLLIAGLFILRFLIRK